MDDQDDVRSLLRLVLEGEGYAVECAANGREALEGIRALRPDLVILDLMMPVMDGWEVLDQLKCLVRPPPVVVLSAAVDPERALRAGAAAALAKPFRLDELLAACSRAIGRSGLQ